MKTWNTMDKADWPSGEWDNEPDKAHWVDESTGLDCLIVRNQLGGLCGYVGIPDGHKYFEKGYDDVHDDTDIDVHGGLTFADKCSDETDESKGICHSKECAANDNVWWLGFDCIHGGDLAPSSIPHALFDSGDVYRDFDYTKNQVTQLAKQLAVI